MSEIVLLGLNHKTASIELRECIAFSPDQTAAALASLKNEPVVSEVLLFSTCNRVEVLLVTDQIAAAVENDPSDGDWTPYMRSLETRLYKKRPLGH